MGTQRDKPATLALFESSLENAAEQLGDITPVVLEQFFGRCPNAEQEFAKHGLSSKETLQAAMVDWGLYCLMTWLERPDEIAIILFDAAKHHDYLKLDPQLTHELFNTLVDVLASTVPVDDIPAQQLWQRLRQELNDALLQAERDIVA